VHVAPGPAEGDSVDPLLPVIGPHDPRTDRDERPALVLTPASAGVVDDGLAGGERGRLLLATEGFGRVHNLSVEQMFTWRKTRLAVTRRGPPILH
jgi:hypothetical protein